MSVKDVFLTTLGERVTRGDTSPSDARDKLAQFISDLATAHPNRDPIRVDDSRPILRFIARKSKAVRR
jgi:hypothetical protein